MVNSVFRMPYSIILKPMVENGIPLHFQNVHDAVSGFKLNQKSKHLQKVIDSDQNILLALKNDHMKNTFQNITTDAQNMQTPKSVCTHNEMTYTLTTAFHFGQNQMTNVETFKIPDGMTDCSTLRLQLRLLCNNNNLWDLGLQEAKTVLSNIVSDAKGFESGWQTFQQDHTVCTKTTNVNDMSVSFFSRQHVFDHCYTHNDEKRLHLDRCANEVSSAMQHMGVCAQRSFVKICKLGQNADNESNTKSDNYLLCLQLLTTPTAEDKKIIQNINSNVYIPYQTKNQHSKNDSVFSVSVTGIKHDAMQNYPRGLCKQYNIQNISIPINKKHGGHDLDVSVIGLQKIWQAAKSISEIHMMTQIGKSILKMRTEKTSEISSITADQKGVHLTDEGKLCAYWNTISNALTETEEKRLQMALKAMKQNNTFKYTFVHGNIHSAATPITDKRLQSMHSIQAKINIKGNVKFPFPLPNDENNRLQVRIDNDWNLECNMICYN